jgi:predicted porin
MMAAAAANAETMAPVAPVAVAAPPAPTLTFGFEITPEFQATDKPGSYESGDLAQTVYKISISKALESGVSLQASLAETYRAPSGGSATTYNQFEVKAGYKYKASPTFSVPFSATLGYAFGDSPNIDPLDPKSTEAYYAFNVGADYKIDKALTWNVIDVRYRDAFNQDWYTPKVTTGFNYEMSPTGSVNASFGKSWKDTGKGLKNDKFSFGLGLKYKF